VNLVENLSSSLANHDALVIVATQLTEINGFVDVSVVNDLQAYLHVRIEREKKQKKFVFGIHFRSIVTLIMKLH
jgi:hypothetical protein